MTRSQRLAALAAGAILLIGIPAAGAHQAPPPDLGEPVVVGRNDPGPTSSSAPSLDNRATERTPTRSPSPGATTRTPDEYGDEDAVAPATAWVEQPEETDLGRTDTAQPVAPKAPVPAGRGADDDTTPSASATSATPSASASDDGSDDGSDDDTGEDG